MRAPISKIPTAQCLEQPKEMAMGWVGWVGRAHVWEAESSQIKRKS